MAAPPPLFYARYIRGILGHGKKPNAGKFAELAAKQVSCRKTASKEMAAAAQENPPGADDLETPVSQMDRRVEVYRAVASHTTRRAHVRIASLEPNLWRQFILLILHSGPLFVETMLEREWSIGSAREGTQ